MRPQEVDQQTERDWDRLAVETGALPFVRPGWLRAAAAGFPRASPLSAVTLRREGELVGVLPVRADGRALRGPVVDEVAACDLVAADRDAARLFGARLLAGPARQVDIGFAPAAGYVAAELAEVAEAHGRPVLLHPQRRQVTVDATGDWTEYERLHLGSDRRKGVARRWRRLREAGAAALEVHHGSGDPDRAAALAVEGFEVEARSWKSAERTAVLARPETATMYTEAVRWAAEAGILRMYLLRLDGRAIGFQLALHQGRTLYAVKVGYDADHARYAPGILTFHGMVRDAFADPDVDSVVVLGEDEGYKREFGHAVAEEVRLRVFAGDRRGLLARAGARAAHEARQELRRRIPEPARRRVVATLNRARP